jgi:hypothetical protein
MKRLVNELTSYIREDTASQQAKKAGYKYLGGGGYWSKTGKPPAEATTRGGSFRLLTAKEKAALAKQEPTQKPQAAEKPSKVAAGGTSKNISQTISALPGGKGVLDAVSGIVDKGTAGAGTPESRAAEASVVLISNSLLQGRKKFKGDIDTYLRNNDDVINSMIAELTSIKDSKLTPDWHKSVKAQIIATLSKTEKKYGQIEALVWDNSEGRSSLGLPKSKDRNDRSDLYIRTKSGEIIGVSLKKSGKIFLANQGYSKIISTIETFTDNPTSKTKIQKLKKLHKQAADAAFADLSKFLKANKRDVAASLSNFNRNGVKSLSSPKYDIYFSKNGAPTKEFINKVLSGEKLASNEFKALLKSLDGVKKQNPKIKKVMDSLRDVDIKATKEFLNAVESDKGVREATTRYLLDALDIPQMLSDSPTKGVNHAVTVYGEGNVDDNGDPVPMYINGETLKETFGISKNATSEQAAQELKTRFIIDAESDKRVGMIRLRITNKTPPPNYYYPAIATLALRARGLGTAAAFELYQHESWTYTLASKSPNPEGWTPQQRKKHAESTVKFLELQLNNPTVGKEEKAQMKKDIEFYSKLK